MFKCLNICNINPLVSGGNKRSDVLKQTCNFYLEVCLSMYDLLLPLGMKGLWLTPFTTIFEELEKDVKNFWT